LRGDISDGGRCSPHASAGTGLLGLRDRAEAAGGTLTIVSPPDRGTVVTATLPLTGG
jgi:signal transduction histidine kinase